MNKPRYSLIDSMRGLSIFSMVLYHMMYDLRFVFDLPFQSYSPLFDRVWQQSICWTFILLSGACRHFTKNHLRRGLTVLGAGVLISFVTRIAMPEQAVHFGILSLVGCAILLTIPLEPLLRRCPPAWGAGGCFALFLMFYNIQRGCLGIGSLRIALPESLYQFRLLAPLGLPDPAFRSADYFPLLPWAFLFFTGYFIWKLLEHRPAVQRALTVRIPLAELIGQHSLLIYLLHQPILMVVLTPIFSR